MKILNCNHKKNGFTIMEVIIAALIFSLAMAGIFASVSELRQPAAESTQEVTAAFIGKRILDDLRKEVSAQTWNSGGNLIPGDTHYLGPYNVDGIDYNATYTVSADPNGTSARMVVLNVTW